MSDLLLVTFTARYIHASFSLRYLKANLKNSGIESEIVELEDQFPVEAVENLIKRDPKIVCFSIHIWNVELIRKCVALLRQVRPQVFIIAGGPELEAISMDDSLVEDVSYIVKGEGDRVIAPLCAYCLDRFKTLSSVADTSFPVTDKILPIDKVALTDEARGCEAAVRESLDGVAQVEGKIIRSFLPDLALVGLPYDLYNEEDIANRVVYVETSRGCPFACHYCASSLEEGVRFFPLNRIFEEFDKLLKRGVHHFKFVDRSFNASPERAAEILRFFLDHESTEFYLHFEFLPVRLPDYLKDLLCQFPSGTLHIEVGIQTFSEEVSRRVGRTMPAAVAEETLTFLLKETTAVVHGDLIIGLPGDTVLSLARSFNRLWALGVQEIQINLLKCLKGTPLTEHSTEFSMEYSAYPPYEVLKTSTMDFLTIRRLHEYSRIFNLLCHSDNFPHVSQIIMSGGNCERSNERHLKDSDPFAELTSFADYILHVFNRSHHISLKILIRSVFDYLVGKLDFSSLEAAQMIASDYYDNGRRKRVPWLEELIREPRA